MARTLKLARLRRRRYTTIPVPLTAKTRVAALGRNKIEIGNLRRFTIQRCADIEAFRPQALIGETADLNALANSSDAGVLDLRSVDTVVLVATEMGERAMTDIERVMLWQAFGVPVYELLVSSDGELIASECEAHVGWHLEPHIQRRSGQIQLGHLETEPCPCGRAESRILIQNDPQLVRVQAAIA